MMQSRFQGLKWDDAASRAAAAGSLPDYEHGALGPEEFRELILGRGAIMLRNAADPQLLDKIQQSLVDLFSQYADIPSSEFERHLASEDPVERDFWEQIKLSHLFDRTFKPFAGYSYFDIIRESGLWDFAGQAFPETELIESAVCNCRRMTETHLPQFCDQPISFHVDSQFFYDEKLSINFWTPLVACGVTAPGLKVVLIGVQETKDYLEYNANGYEPGPDDIARMNKFRCHKMSMDSLEANGLLESIWAPEFNKGDVLAFTNFTMHATHYSRTMTQPRTSVEVRVDLPSVAF
jgi:hypothetical protein